MEIIRFNESDVSKAKSMQDFYERIEIWERFQIEKTDVSQLWMNQSQNEELNKALKKNAKKNKELKGLSQTYLDQLSAMDWLNFSPVSDESIPRNELWILSKSEAEARRNSI